MTRRLLKQVADIFSVRTDNAELLKAQYHAFSQQLPMMYLILLASSWAVAITHLSVVPAALGVGVPVTLTIICVVRLTLWWRSRTEQPTAEMASRALERTKRLALLLSLGFAGWALALYPYGDAYTRSHLAFYLAITGIGCIFCLMHLRAAAFKVALVVNATFIGFFAFSGHATLVATAINVVLVSIAMLVILMINYRDFTRMIDAQVRTQALSDENLRLANLDSLTELPNRRAFFAHLRESYEKSVAREARLAVGVLDLDGFKPVNDLHGHSAGDRLLVAVGLRLATVCERDNVHLSRLGGDEFAVVVSDADDDETLLQLGEEICAALREPFVLPDATVQISGSIGFAVHPEMARSSEDLFEHADYALYHGKRTNRGRATLFSSDHNDAIHRDARIEQALQMADLAGELDVVFQPIVDITRQSTIGFEALARWNSPVLGRVSPTHFIPVAERAGLVSRLTRPLLEKALATAKQWPAHIRLAFNLSAHDLSSPEGVLSVVAIIEKSGFDPRRLDLEITETAFTHDFGQVQKAIDMLKLMGCGISLDDFGTGYSSLSRLHALPLTKIKIDRSFVTDLHVRPASLKIVKSLLALSRDMGLDCVIEGVETAEEMEALKSLGGLMVQGYFYSPPLSGADLEPFLGPRQENRHA